MTRIKKYNLLAILLISTGLSMGLSGCGQKGSLYLPEISVKAGMKNQGTK